MPDAQTTQGLALLKEQAIPEIADLLGTMDPKKVLAVQAFAVCLKAGAVSPGFFTLIAGALQGLEASQ